MFLFLNLHSFNRYLIFIIKKMLINQSVIKANLHLFCIQFNFLLINKKKIITGAFY